MDERIQQALKQVSTETLGIIQIETSEPEPPSFLGIHKTEDMQTFIYAIDSNSYEHLCTLIGWYEFVKIFSEKSHPIQIRYDVKESIADRAMPEGLPQRIRNKQEVVYSKDFQNLGLKQLVLNN